MLDIDHEIKRSHKKKSPVDYLPAEVAVKMSTLPPAEIENAFKPFKPSGEQLRLVDVLYRRGNDRKRLTYKALSCELKLSQKTIYNWFTDTGFLLWLKQIRSVQFSAWRPIVDSLLMKQIYKGKRWAFELFYELGGDLSKTIEERSMVIKNYDSISTHDRFTLFQERLSKLSGDIHEELPSTNQAGQTADYQEVHRGTEEDGNSSGEIQSEISRDSSSHGQ